MKYLITTALFVFLGLGSLFAQVDENDVFTEEVGVEEVEVAPPVATTTTGVSAASADLQVAQAEYKAAQTRMNEAHSAFKQSENEVESARMALKQAQRAAHEEAKAANPVVISRYEVNINPILEDMSKGNQYGYSMFLYGSEAAGITKVLSKTTDAEFKKFLKQYDAGKIKKTKGELFFDDIHIPEISSSRMDIYVDFVKEDSGVNMKTFFNLGSGFLNSTEESAAAGGARSLLDRFARHMRTVEVEQELKEQEKELVRLQKSLEKNQTTILKSRDDIVKNEQTIAESKINIDETESLLIQQNDLLDQTREKLSKIN